MNINSKHNKKNSSSSTFSLKELELNIEKLSNIVHTPIIKNKESNYCEYRVDYPQICNDTNNIELKKYVGLVFYETEDIDNSCTESNFCERYHIFLELNMAYIINYSIVLSINKIDENNNNKYSIFIGTKKRNSQKINTIKGSKVFFDTNDDENNAKITINNTFLYFNKEESELYIIAQLDKNCTINSKKSYIKILQQG
jgi:hypothetical protein